MDFDRIVAKILAHPWIALALIVIMALLIYAAWRRTMRERQRHSIEDPWTG